MKGKSLYDVLTWVRQNGEARALGRLRLRVLPFTVRERVRWDAVDPRTACSPEYLREVEKAAAAVVGRPLPF